MKKNSKENGRGNIISERENEWLQLLYEEAWRQYVHEDEMAEQRDSKYLTIFSLIFSALGVILTMLITSIVELDFSIIKNCVYFLGIQGVVFIILVIILLLTIHWKQVTEAGQEFTKIRFDVAKEIEQKIDIDISIAKNEEEKIKKIQAGKKTYIEGFESTKRIIRIFGVVTMGLLITNIVVMIIVAIAIFNSFR